jgi:predicted transposase YdaD
MREEDEKARLAKVEQKGKEEGKRELVIEMYKDELPIERIAKIAKLSIEQVEQIISGYERNKK